MAPLEIFWAISEARRVRQHPSARDVRHDRATTSAVRGGVLEHLEIPTVL